MRTLRNIKPIELLEIAGSRDIYDLLLAVLKLLVKRARGTLVTFRSTHIGYTLSEVLGSSIEGSIDLNRKAWARVRDFVEFMADLGLIKRIKRTARGMTYGIERGSAFWTIPERGDVTCIARVLKRAYETIRKKGTEVPTNQVIEELLMCITM